MTTSVLHGCMMVSHTNQALNEALHKKINEHINPAQTLINLTFDTKNIPKLSSKIITQTLLKHEEDFIQYDGKQYDWRPSVGEKYPKLFKENQDLFVDLAKILGYGIHPAKELWSGLLKSLSEQMKSDGVHVLSTVYYFNERADNYAAQLQKGSLFNNEKSSLLNIEYNLSEAQTKNIIHIRAQSKEGNLRTYQVYTEDYLTKALNALKNYHNNAQKIVQPFLQALRQECGRQRKKYQDEATEPKANKKKSLNQQQRQAIKENKEKNQKITGIYNGMIRCLDKYILLEQKISTRTSTTADTSQARRQQRPATTLPAQVLVQQPVQLRALASMVTAEENRQPTISSLLAELQEKSSTMHVYYKNYINTKQEYSLNQAQKLQFLTAALCFNVNKNYTRFKQTAKVSPENLQFFKATCNSLSNSTIEWTLMK